MHHNDRWKVKTPAWQNQGTNARTDVSHSRHNCDIGSDAAKL